MCDSGEVNPICFDLEGPLAPQDNAYELMRLFPNGNRVFEVISRYDDLLTLQGRADYEPGDTLALTAPFLACHGIRESQIANMGRKAKLTSGALRLVARLKSRGWEVFCISTSYEQYALSITARLLPRFLWSDFGGFSAKMIWRCSRRRKTGSPVSAPMTRSSRPWIISTCMYYQRRTQATS